MAILKALVSASPPDSGAIEKADAEAKEAKALVDAVASQSV